MKSKDKFDSVNKEGCARVYYHKKFKIIHSYTVECGYFYPNKLNPLNEYLSMDSTEGYSYTSDWENCSLDEYHP